MRKLSLVVVLCLVSNANAETIYSYDPAQTYGGHSWSTTQDALASSFTLPTESPTYTVCQLRIRISYTNEPITPITVCIWDNDNGHPGSLIWSQNEADVNGPTTDAASYWWWNTFAPASSPVIAGGATIFVGYASSWFADIAPSWSANTNMEGIQGSWERNLSSGEWSYKTLDRKIQLDIVPEPSTIILLAIGSIGLLGYVWRRRKRAA